MSPEEEAAPVWQSRPTLTIWVYDSPMGAAAGEVRLRNLAHGGSVNVMDAVTAMWVPGSHRPRIGFPRVRAGPDDHKSVLAVFVDQLTAANGGDVDPVVELADRLAGSGVDDRLLRDARTAFTQSTSALLVLSTAVDLDTVRPAVEHGLARGDVLLMHAYLAPGGLDVLRHALGRD